MREVDFPDRPYPWLQGDEERAQREEARKARIKARAERLRRLEDEGQLVDAGDEDVARRLPPDASHHTEPAHRAPRPLDHRSTFGVARSSAADLLLDAATRRGGAQGRGFGVGLDLDSGSARGGSSQEAAEVAMQRREMEKLRRQNEELRKITAAQRKVLAGEGGRGGGGAREGEEGVEERGMKEYLERVRAMEAEEVLVAAVVEAEKGVEDDWEEQEDFFRRAGKGTGAGQVSQGKGACKGTGRGYVRVQEGDM